MEKSFHWNFIFSVRCCFSFFGALLSFHFDANVHIKVLLNFASARRCGAASSANAALAEIALSAGASRTQT